MKAKNNKQAEVLGYCEFGAYLHRDNGGKAKVAAYTSVNKPLSVEAHDETTKIASRRYKIIEEERAELDGNKFYSKDIWNEQEGSGKTTTEPSSQRTEYSDPEDKQEQKQNGSPLSKEGHFLKNMVDNLWADMRQLRGTALMLSIGALVVAVAAIVIALT